MKMHANLFHNIHIAAVVLAALVIMALLTIGSTPVIASAHASFELRAIAAFVIAASVIAVDRWAEHFDND